MNTPERIQYTATSCWTTGNQVEATVPAGVRNDCHATGTQTVALTPTLNPRENTISFTVTMNASGDRANHRRLKGRDDSAQVTLRLPAVLAAATGLLSKTENRSKQTLSFSRSSDDTGQFTATPKPTVVLDSRDVDTTVQPATKRLLDFPTAYGIELDNRFVRALTLSHGSPIEWRLAIRDGRLSLVGNFGTQNIDEDAPNVRSVQVHQSGVDDALTDQYRLYIPKVLVESLYWEDLKLQFQLDGTEIVVSPAPSTDHMAVLDDALPVKDVPGTEPESESA